MPALEDIAPEDQAGSAAFNDWRAFSSMASSPACSPRKTSRSDRLADLTTAAMASVAENSRSVRHQAVPCIVASRRASSRERHAPSGCRSLTDCL